jgi:hypothetical protein
MVYYYKDVIKKIDLITEELANIKKALFISNKDTRQDKSKAAWSRILEASNKVKWDKVTAVDEIRMQRDKE